jgi:cytochrome c oxidase cbb3-type subunit 4
VDVNELRSAVTVLLFVLFIGIVAWAVAPRNKARFDAAQQLPFQGELPSTSMHKDKPHE